MDRGRCRTRRKRFAARGGPTRGACARFRCRRIESRRSFTLCSAVSIIQVITLDCCLYLFTKNNWTCPTDIYIVHGVIENNFGFFLFSLFVYGLKSYLELHFYENNNNNIDI